MENLKLTHNSESHVVCYDIPNNLNFKIPSNKEFIELLQAQKLQNQSKSKEKNN